MAGTLSANQRIYLQPTIDGSSNPIFSATFPNTSGTSTLAASNFCNHIDCNITPSTAVLQNMSKTGTLSQLRGVRGRSAASWDLTMHMQGSGAAGTAPDAAPLIQAMFGAKPTISAGVSVTYTLADAICSFSLFKFFQPSADSHSHQAVWGAMPSSLRFALSGDLATIQASGIGGFALDRNLFASMDADAKGGLTAFPAEPASPVANGSPVVGFVGSVTINSVGTFEVLDMSVDVNRPVDLRYAYGKYYPTVAGNGRREIPISFTIADDDGANWTALKLLGWNKTVFDITLVMGATAGNIWTWTLKNVQVDMPTYDEGGTRRAVRFTGNANATSTTTRDEVSLVLT